MAHPNFVAGQGIGRIKTMAHAVALQRDRAVFGENRAIHWQSRRIGLLYHGEQSGAEFWDTLGDLRESVFDCDGQFISLDLTEPLAETFPAMFYAALKNARWERSLSFSLPVILQHNPRVASPFLNQAILWQRLCDLIIVDDESSRKTITVLENIDQASPAVQHEIARLIRFHAVHGIHRSFVFTLDCHSCDQIIPELRAILDIYIRAC